MSYFIGLEVKCNKKLTRSEAEILGEHLRDMIYDDQDEFETINDIVYEVAEDKE